MSKPIVKVYTNEDMTGEIANFPPHILMKMLKNQVEQDNEPDPEVFQKDASADKRHGGFNWDESPEGADYWVDVMKKYSPADAKVKERVKDRKNILKGIVKALANSITELGEDAPNTESEDTTTESEEELHDYYVFADKDTIVKKAQMLADFYEIENPFNDSQVYPFKDKGCIVFMNRRSQLICVPEEVENISMLNIFEYKEFPEKKEADKPVKEARVITAAEIAEKFGVEPGSFVVKE